MRRLTVGLMFVTAYLTSLPVARAVSCTVQGTIRIESMDTYYCDPDIAGINCTGWKETDLDDKHEANAPPMRYAYILVTDTSNNTLAQTYTNGSGFYSTPSFSLPACSGNIRLHAFLVRVDPANFPLYGYFRISANSAQELTQGRYWTEALTGSTTTIDKTVQSGSNPTEFQRAATVYHTAESAISEIRTWSTNLANRFYGSFAIDGTGMPRICYDDSPDCLPAGGGLAQQANWRILLAYSAYNFGSITRHEIGHLVHFAVHNRNMTLSCDSTGMLSSPPVPEVGCEYGYNAVVEGLPSYFAVMSIVTSVTSNTGNGAFLCKCAGATNSDQDRCSDAAAAVGSDSDAITQCAGGTDSSFQGYGDDFVTTGRCARLRPGRTAYGCECLDGSDPGTNCDDYPAVPEMCPDDLSPFNECDDYAALGWRNTIQVGRYLWDVMDTKNESSQDDVDLTREEIIAAFESMPCTAGQEHSCNEPNTSPCVPNPAGAPLPPPSDQTRDSYNVADIAWRLWTSWGGNHDSEKALNCVDGADD